jgi:hypothetical protein
LEKVVIKTMTQYKYKVLQRKRELELEGLDKEWSFMEAKYDKGKLVSITTGFKSGRRLTEYTDKRKKDKEEWQ